MILIREQPFKSHPYKDWQCREIVHVTERVHLWSKCPKTIRFRKYFDSYSFVRNLGYTATGAES